MKLLDKGIKKPGTVGGIVANYFAHILILSPFSQRKLVLVPGLKVSQGKSLI